MKHRVRSGLVAITMAAATQGVAQVRQDIYDFSVPERELLYQLMTDYIDASVLYDHCVMQETTGGMIHSDWDFLPFHRTYLERLEDFLIAQGHPEFVPLPYWNPNVAAPSEFRVDPDGAGPMAQGVDPDCGSFICDAFHAAVTCENIMEWDPQIDRADYPYLNLPVVAGANNDLCDHPMLPTFPDDCDCFPSGLSRKIENPYHDLVHVDMGDPDPNSPSEEDGVMGNFRSPAAPIFWIWHAYVDDIWKEWQEFCPISELEAADLYMKDTPKVVDSERDHGEEPNIDPGPMWITEDIWVRNLNDGIQEHQNAEYGESNFVYVRVRNRGFDDSPAGLPLNLYWSKAGTAMAWSAHWDGTMTTPALMGDVIDGPHLLPSIPAGSSHIEIFEWDNVPNPATYAAIGSDPIFWANQPWHFCLLARVEDGLSMPETSDVFLNTKNNNNAVQKNMSIVDMEQIIGGGGWPDDKVIGASVITGDAWGQGGTYDLVFQNPVPCKGNPVTAEAEVRVTLDAPLWALWEAGGMQMENMAISRETRYQLIVTGNPARLKNITYHADQRLLAHVGFNFLARQMSGQPRFLYDMFQTKNGSLVGGERYDIRVPGRPGFYANAGPDKQISPNTSTGLNASGIGESAIYNWYDPEGNLIHTGTDLTVSPDVTTKYKLEVIAEVDGVKDYDEVDVKIKEHEITGVAPNPAIGSVQVAYRLTDATSAYLQLSAPYSAVSNQYILNVGGDQATLNLSGVPPGIYNLRLFVNGQPMDLKNVTVL